MKLIILQGGAATGKTMMARRLSKDLKIKTFLKDDYKEGIYEKAGKKLNIFSWSRLEKQSFHELYKAVGLSIENNESLIVDGNFLPFQKSPIEKLLKPNCTVVEVYLYADANTIFKRYVHRNESKERHWGHRDRLWYPLVFVEAFFIRIGLRLHRPLRISDNVLKINTSNYGSIDYDEIKKFIKKFNSSNSKLR